MYIANGVDISCFLLIFSLLHTLFCSNRISESPAYKLQVEQALNDSARIIGQALFPRSSSGTKTVEWLTRTDRTRCVSELEWLFHPRVFAEFGSRLEVVIRVK